jgi:hypothetical protein
VNPDGNPLVMVTYLLEVIETEAEEEIWLRAWKEEVELIFIWSGKVILIMALLVKLSYGEKANVYLVLSALM